MAKHKTISKAEPGSHEMLTIREYDAPRELVFKAYTDPKLAARWLGPRDLTMDVKTWEPRSGGSYRYVHRDPEGNSYAFHGVFHEVKPPERIVQTFEYEMPDGRSVSLETVEFEELSGNRTRVTSRSIVDTVEARDAMIAQMGEGAMEEIFARLDELLEQEQRQPAGH